MHNLCWVSAYIRKSIYIIRSYTYIEYIRGRRRIFLISNSLNNKLCSKNNVEGGFFRHRIAFFSTDYIITSIPTHEHLPPRVQIHEYFDTSIVPILLCEIIIDKTRNWLEKRKLDDSRNTGVEKNHSLEKKLHKTYRTWTRDLIRVWKYRRGRKFRKTNDTSNTKKISRKIHVAKKINK